METTKRLEISSALAGLAGIILTVSGLFLPWGTIIHWYGEILIPLNGFQANYTLTGIYAVVALCIEILGFFLLLQGMRKMASAILAAAASFMIIQTVMWLMSIRPLPFQYQIAHIENTGPYATLVGSSFIMFATVLSLLQLRLSS